MRGTCTTEPSHLLAGHVAELHQPSGSAEQGRGDIPKPIFPSAAHGFGPGGRSCPGHSVKGPSARGRLTLGSHGLTGSTRAGSPCRCFRGTEEQCAGPLGFCWKPGSPAGPHTPRGMLWSLLPGSGELSQFAFLTSPFFFCRRRRKFLYKNGNTPLLPSY